MHTTTTVAPTTAAFRLPLAAIFAIAFGALLVFAAGFAGGAVHDAAHDTRHAYTLPCH